MDTPTDSSRESSTWKSMRALKYTLACSHYKRFVSAIKERGKHTGKCVCVCLCWGGKHTFIA